MKNANSWNTHNFLFRLPKSLKQTLSWTLLTSPASSEDFPRTATAAPLQTSPRSRSTRYSPRRQARHLHFPMITTARKNLMACLRRHLWHRCPAVPYQVKMNRKEMRHRSHRDAGWSRAGAAPYREADASTIFHRWAAPVSKVASRHAWSHPVGLVPARDGAIMLMLSQDRNAESYEGPIHKKSAAKPKNLSRLAPGASNVTTALRPPHALGQALFNGLFSCQRAGNDTEERVWWEWLNTGLVLLLRLVHTQINAAQACTSELLCCVSMLQLSMVPVRFCLDVVH